MKKLKQLKGIVQKISQVEGLLVTEKGGATIDTLFQKTIKNPKFLSVLTSDFEAQYNVVLKEEEVDILFLTSFRFRWCRPEVFSKEGYLEGGFAFNGLTDLYRMDANFWKASIDHFTKFESEEKVDYSFLESLKWVESNYHFLNSDTGNLPYTACVTLETGMLPKNFYFYDGGLVFELMIDSYEAYVNALAASSGVTCWQYFFISPEEVIQKNKGINYCTWNLKTSDLIEGINDLNYHDNITYDRLDLVAEYLERCVRLLPSTFPFLDFSYHIDYYKKFKKLYDELI